MISSTEDALQEIVRLPWGKEGYTLLSARLEQILEDLWNKASEEGYDRCYEDYGRDIQFSQRNRDYDFD